MSRPEAPGSVSVLQAVAPPEGWKRRRAAAGLGFVILLLLGLVGRLVQVQIVEGERYRQLARRQRIVESKLAACRGAILDCRGRELAMSVSGWSVFADPSVIEDPERTARTLAGALRLSSSAVQRQLKRPGFFAWIKRQVSEAEAERVRRLSLRGIHLRREPRRLAPQGSTAACVVGFTDIDGKGLEGAELAFDSLLTGAPGQEQFSRDGRRRIMLSSETAAGRPPFNGSDIVLTIDSFIQHIAEQELRRAALFHKAKRAIAVVLDPHTGDLLSMACWPSFNANSPADSPPENRKNRAVTDAYEFGSVLKPIGVAAALQEGIVTPESEFDCQGGKWRTGKRTVHDVHPYGVLSVSDIISRSSNIGVAQIALSSGKDVLYRYARKFGFGEQTGVHLPGETDGILTAYPRWNDYTVVSVAFGQEIALSPLSVVRAFAVFANGGLLLRPRIIRRVESASGRAVLYQAGRPEVVRRVLSSETARVVMEMLCRVVDEGTGRRAQLENYTVAGKTGTAQLLSEDGSGYSHSLFRSSFVGIAPARQPRIVVLVTLEEPRENGYYGGVVAAPACREIMRRTLAYLEVPPDRPGPLESRGSEGESG